MVDVAQYINEVKRDSDHLVIIQKVKVNGLISLIIDLRSIDLYVREVLSSKVKTITN